MPPLARLVILGLGACTAAIGALQAATRWANWHITHEPAVKRAPPRHPMRGR